MLWIPNLQTMLRTAQHKTRMCAAIQTAGNNRLGNAVSVNARVNAAIERKYGELQPQSIAAQRVSVRASILVKRADDAKKLYELMLLEFQSASLADELGHKRGSRLDSMA